MKNVFKLLAVLACLLLPCAGVLGLAGPACAEGWLEEFVASMKKDANAGDVEAQTTLGVMYYEGQGVQQDYAEARRWLAMAAEQDSPEAQLALGEICEEGRGIAKDEGQALSWYRKAAFHASPEAMYRLGDMLAEGRGAARDRTQALEWFGKACQAGHKPSCERSRSLAEKNF